VMQAFPAALVVHEWKHHSSSIPPLAFILSHHRNHSEEKLSIHQAFDRRRKQ